MTNLIANNLHAKRVFKMCQSLALLPADQIPVQGFGHIQGYAEQHGLMDDDLIQQFLDYVNRIWIQGKVCDHYVKGMLCFKLLVVFIKY